MSKDGQVKPLTLFEQPVYKAGIVAAKASGSRRARILAALADGPLAIFEIAERMGVMDHQIAGRFSEMERDLLIHRTGKTGRKESTGCDAELYALGNGMPTPARAQADAGELLGYPATLIIDGEKFDRAPLDGDKEPPGIPYARDAEGGGLRVVYRVGLVECEGCGRLVKLVRDGDKKTWHCGTPTCNRVWHLMIVREPGGKEVLALVGKTG